MGELTCDLLAIGGGTAGLVSAAGAAYLGLKPGLVEREALGGDCLWTGCVPSKALIASARLAHGMRNAESLGLNGTVPVHEFASVMERMRSARNRVARHDDPERFRDLGVTVHAGEARFLAPGLVEVEGVGRIRSGRIILATGAGPTVPPIPGLEKAGFLNHVTALDQERIPGSILVIGGGPVGLEFAQMYGRLGARVTVVELLPRILSREDTDTADTLRRILEEEGIRFRLGTEATAVRVQDGQRILSLADGTEVKAEEIFVATGRTPRTSELDLERGGVERDGQAIRVDETLRTTARGVWAAGDVTGGPQFTHVADYMARTALRNAVFPFNKKVSYEKIPRVTYTDPELAHVGMLPGEARERGGSTFDYSFAELDRAIVDAETSGFVRISADRRGRILGATILGRGAGDLLAPLVLSMEQGISLKAISDAVFPYPTRAEGLKRAAAAFQRKRLQSAGGILLKRMVSWLT